MGRGRFSPDTLRGMGTEGNGRTVLGAEAGAEDGVGIWDWKGDFETRFVLFSLLNVFDERRAICDGCC
jgi:hypothetical protein